MPQRCGETKRNRRVPDFECDRNFPHTDAHHDPLTGTPWRHPTQPYGVKNPPPTNGSRSKTKHGCTWSDAPVKS